MSNSVSETTIAAIATGMAAGGIGVIRISGPEAINVADRVFDAVSGKALAESAGYQAHFGSVHDGSGWHDEAVALVFRAPHSYTGEDVVELSCHGGLGVTKMTLRACLDAGATMAGAGEFTRRAFENGRISLTQAEGVMAVISAQGRQQALAAQSALDGRLHTRTEKIRALLIDVAARLSAWCDFSDEEDIPTITRSELINELTDAKNMLEKLVSEGDAGCLLREGIDTVICGRPNVGKSTLMNFLAGEQRSIVTDIPGTTRDIVEETVNVGGCVLKLADTAGIHDTDDIIETIGVTAAKSRLESCALVLAVFDGSEALTDDDISLIESISDRPCVAVINKGDKPQIIDNAFISDKIQRIVYISAGSGTGMDELYSAIADVTKLSQLDPSAGVIINERQLECANRALNCVSDALSEAQADTMFDALNVLIYDCIDALSEMSGERVSDTVINEVFSKFCIGK